MEIYWNKKRIAILLSGQQEAVEEFLNQYKPVLFTWMYYQVGADARIASDLTARTFTQALERLHEFDPNQHTLYQWLKEQAKIARDEGLLHWQLKPQRPWAWSQLPDLILEALSKLRLEPLRESVAANPFVQEIVQASLAELEQNDRELMMHRYSHLDTADKIATEMNLSIEKVSDLLYKCRHAFRRVFFQLISSVNPGFAESTAGSGIEVLDNNLEKLLRATAMYLSPSAEQDILIRERVLETAQRIGQAQPLAKKRPQWLIAAASVAAVLLIGVIFLSMHLHKQTPEVLPVQANQSAKHATNGAAVKNGSAKPQTNPKDMDEEQLKMIFQLGQSGNLEALLEILKSGHFTSQVAAAHFVGKLGKPSAIALLEQAENQWYPNGPADNPFAAAIDEIAKRYPDQVGIAQKQPIASPEPAQTAKPETLAVEGFVRDFADKPVAGAELELVRSGFQAAAQQPAAKTVTTEDGHWAIKQVLEGPFLLKCRPSMGAADSTSRAIWCSKQKAGSVNFGGKPVITGRLQMNGRPISGLKLALSDTLEPTKAAFYAETIAAADGSFSFTGVRPGVYSLLSPNENQKLVRLSVVDVRGTDVLAFDLDLQPMSILVEYPEPNAIEAATLAYQLEPSTVFDEKSGRVLDGGSVLFENVLAGSYLLKAKMNNGIRLQQVIEVQPHIDDQIISLEALPPQTISVKGKMTGAGGKGLFLVSPDQRIVIDIPIDPDGNYELAQVPADLYGLGYFVNGQLLELTKIDLRTSAEAVIDLDVEQLTEPLGPLYVIVTDSKASLLSGARVWLTGGNDVIAGETTGKGAFLAAPAGTYTLQTLVDGHDLQSKEIVVKKAPLTSGPIAENTVIIELSQ